MLKEPLHQCYVKAVCVVDSQGFKSTTQVQSVLSEYEKRGTGKFRFLLEMLYLSYLK